MTDPLRLLGQIGLIAVEERRRKEKKKKKKPTRTLLACIKWSDPAAGWKKPVREVFVWWLLSSHHCGCKHMNWWADEAAARLQTIGADLPVKVDKRWQKVSCFLFSSLCFVIFLLLWKHDDDNDDAWKKLFRSVTHFANKRHLAITQRCFRVREKWFVGHRLALNQQQWCCVQIFFLSFFVFYVCVRVCVHIHIYTIYILFSILCV